MRAVRPWRLDSSRIPFIRTHFFLLHQDISSVRPVATDGRRSPSISFRIFRNRSQGPATSAAQTSADMAFSTVIRHRGPHGHTHRRRGARTSFRADRSCHLPQSGNRLLCAQVIVQSLHERGLDSADRPTGQSTDRPPALECGCLICRNIAP